MVLLSLLAGCVILRADVGAVARYEPDEAPQPEVQTHLAAGMGLGALQVNLGLQTRPSARGFEVALSPEACGVGAATETFLLGGCLGVTLIGGGVRNGDRTVMFGGPYADLHALVGLTELGEGAVFLRFGPRGGLDVRTLGPSPVPYIGGAVGVEIWWFLVPERKSKPSPVAP